MLEYGMIMRLYLKNKSNDRIRWIVSVIDKKMGLFFVQSHFCASMSTLNNRLYLL